LYAWGGNAQGQLGDNTVVSKSSPIQVGSLTTWSKVSAGQGFSHAIKTDNTMWAWGSGSYGRLGNGTVVNQSSPVQVGALTNWTHVSSGKSHVVSVKTDGTMWAWGSNYFGQLGQNNTINRSSPVQIGALTTWSQASAGSSFSLAVKTDGTLWAWGLNFIGAGQLGDGTAINRSSPVQVGALTNWDSVSAGSGYSSAAVKTNGTLWGWGGGSGGKLGDGAAIDRSSPVQIGALTTWAIVSMGDNSCGAVKTDGTLWTWGANFDGSLGHNNAIARSSPVQVGSLSDWYTVSGSKSGAGERITSVKTDGTLWVWGGNSLGQLGDGTTVSRSSPIQVGAKTNWNAVSLGNVQTVAITKG
jgi:alpha-tubulin suppressor-like RCC1 family protein